MYLRRGPALYPGQDDRGLAMNSTHYELHFRSMFDPGRGYSFPCDAQGRVPLDDLSDRARDNYLYARAVVGRELAVPAVRASALAVLPH
jgi:hypothetical protein